MTMTTDNENKRKKIAEIQRQKTENSVQDNLSGLSAPEQQMLELLRVDTLMRSMRTLIGNEKDEINNEFDKALSNFIVAYRGSVPLIYGDKQEAGFEKVLQSVKDNIKIAADFSVYKNVPAVMDCIPETVSQVSEINNLLVQISTYEKELANLVLNKASSGKSEKDEVAEKILNIMVERSKKKDKNFKIEGFIYGAEAITVKVVSKTGKTAFMVNQTLFAPLNTMEGIERLNHLLVMQSQKNTQKSSIKSDNEKINENKKVIAKNITEKEKELDKMQQLFAKTIQEYMQKLPAKELLDAFAPRNGQDTMLREILVKSGNFNELKKELAKSLEYENKIWNYVSDKKYYDMMKNVVRSGYDKKSLVYKAMPEPLKKLLTVREIALYGLKNPDTNSVEEMNNLLEKQGLKINLQKINVSTAEKPKEYSAKSGGKVADLILIKAQKAESEAQISPYNRRYMTLGLMYCLGEGADKNDDSELFKKYMLIYFNKKNLSALDVIKLKKDYGWDEFKQKNLNVSKDTYQEIKEIYGWKNFKQNNAASSKGVYKEIKNNAVDAEVLKAGLLNGIWADAGVSSVHHILPRRFGVCADNPDELNNQANLAVTVQWKAWQEDNHQLEHYFNMSQYDGVLSYLTKENGEYARAVDTTDLSEVYYEKPQVKKDGKWVDLIPNNTLLVTPHIIVVEPELPNNVKHLAANCFKPVSFVENTINIHKGAKEKQLLEYA